jgi:hypothetical protein
MHFCCCSLHPLGLTLVVLRRRSYSDCACRLDLQKGDYLKGQVKQEFVKERRSMKVRGAESSSLFGYMKQNNHLKRSRCFSVKTRYLMLIQVCFYNYFKSHSTFALLLFALPDVQLSQAQFEGKFSG